MADDGTLTSSQVRRQIGVTYRQLDYWVRMGALPLPNARPGTGTRRHWTPADVEQAQAVAVLVKAGIQPAALAGALDTLLVGEDWFAVRLGRLNITGTLR